MRGVCAIVTERGAVAMDACGVRRVHSRRTETLQRTAKSCGPGAATLASIRPARAGTATVATKAVHRGEHEVSRKAIARGKPGCPGCTCQTRVHSTATLRTRRCGRSRRPAFPAPSLNEEGATRCKTQASPSRENEHTCLPVIASYLAWPSGEGAGEKVTHPVPSLALQPLAFLV